MNSKKTNVLNVRDTGAIGDGVADDRKAIQRALDSGAEIVYIPSGTYRIAGTLKVPSHSNIEADSDARLFHCGSFPKQRGDFLLSNSDTENGNTDISIKGGIWDGNYDGKNNTKSKDLFNPDAASGTVLNFLNVRNLSLTDIVVANSVVYFVRLCKIDGFEFKNIGFSARQLSFNQDGLHFGGECRNGTVENIKALTNGETNDDMIALNADDCITRLENRDHVCGDIENITFRNIYAENCYTAIRMLSAWSSIKNITFENVFAGCRLYAVNMDGGRYTRTPLIDEADYPNGCGNIENVHIKGLTIYSTKPDNDTPFIGCESRVKNFTVTDLKRIKERDENPNKPLMRIKNLVDTEFVYMDSKGEHRVHINTKNDTVTIHDEISRFELNASK